MEIFLKNDCGYIVYVSLESGENIEINPHSTVSIQCQKNNNFICIKQGLVSFKKNKKYTLVLETQYRVININNNDVFRITRKKVRVRGNVYYDRLFLDTETAICSMEKNNVLGAEEIKKKFNKSRIRYMLFISPFEHLTGLVIISILLGIVLGYNLDWKSAIIYFLFSYIFLLVLNWVIEKVDKLLFNKAFKLEDEKNEFYNYFENEFIAKYYSELEQ